MTKVNSQKYSKALLEVAQEKGQLEAILTEVSEMIQLFKENNLGAFLANIKSPITINIFAQPETSPID